MRTKLAVQYGYWPLMFTWSFIQSEASKTMPPWCVIRKGVCALQRLTYKNDFYPGNAAYTASYIHKEANWWQEGNICILLTFLYQNITRKCLSLTFTAAKPRATSAHTPNKNCGYLKGFVLKTGRHQPRKDSASVLTFFMKQLHQHERSCIPWASRFLLWLN